MWTELSDTAILKAIGSRIRACRIGQNMQQSELAAESGVGLNTIGKIEAGKPVSVLLLISVLRTLNLLENLEMLVPEEGISPMQLLKLKGKQQQRVRHKPSNF